MRLEWVLTHLIMWISVCVAAVGMRNWYVPLAAAVVSLVYLWTHNTCRDMTWAWTSIHVVMWVGVSITAAILNEPLTFLSAVIGGIALSAAMGVQEGDA